MALSDYQVMKVIRSTIGLLGKYGDDMKNREIFDKVIDRLDITNPSDRASVWTYIRTGRNLLAEGAAVEAHGASPPAYRPTIRDRGANIGDTGYSYRVRVEVRDPNTLTAHTYVVDIIRSTPQTAADLRTAAVAEIQANPTGNDRYPERFAGGGPLLYDAMVLTAGRR